MNASTNLEPSLFIQFAGQGVKYMEGLRQNYQMFPKIRPFVDKAIAIIKEQAAKYDDRESQFYTHGLDVDQWIADPGKTPNLSYLLSSPISHPLIYLTQISSYISLLLEGIDQAKLLANTHSTTGFSTGIVAAMLVSTGLPVDEFCDLAHKVQAMFFWQGVRCQESMLKLGDRPQLNPELLSAPEGSPSCMASINNITRSHLDEAIATFKSSGEVHLAYGLFPGRWIVAGLTNSLPRFKDFLLAKYENVAWKYIPSTIGAHSPILRYALETTPADADRVGVEFNGKAMKIPVWANDTGEDVRTKDNIMHDVMRAYFTCPAVWRKQIAPLLPPTKIKYVLDFGPGPGVASLTENHTTQSGINIVLCTNPLGRKMLFEKVLPSLQ